jgi:small subunit ribosomal protein S19e
LVRAYDVPADELIAATAEHLKKIPQIYVPEWAAFVKTGSHGERPPQQAGWWYSRSASLMRKLYFHGPVGLSVLQREYGGSKTTGYSPKHHRDAGSSILRRILKQLEQAELVSKDKKGRLLTPKGIALLDKTSREIFKKLAEKNGALVRYQ